LFEPKKMLSGSPKASLRQPRVAGVSHRGPGQAQPGRALRRRLPFEESRQPFERGLEALEVGRRNRGIRDGRARRRGLADGVEARRRERALELREPRLERAQHGDELGLGARLGRPHRRRRPAREQDERGERAARDRGDRREDQGPVHRDCAIVLGRRRRRAAE
jgi:hypothetical protein